MFLCIYRTVMFSRLTCRLCKLELGISEGGGGEDNDTLVCTRYRLLQKQTPLLRRGLGTAGILVVDLI